MKGATAIWLLAITVLLTGCAPLDRWFVWALAPQAAGEPFGEDPPPLLSAQAGDGRVQLSWEFPPGYPSRQERVVYVYRSTQRGGARQGEPFRRIATVEGLSTTYVDTGVTNGATYYYRATARPYEDSEVTRASNTVPATPGGGASPCKPPNCPRRSAAVTNVPSSGGSDPFGITFTTSSLFHGHRSVVAGKRRERAGQADGTFSATLGTAASRRGYSTGTWRMSLDLLYDPKLRKGSATWLALAMFDDSDAGELCLRFKAAVIASGSNRRTLEQRLTFASLGGTGAAARLRINGSSSRTTKIAASTSFAPPKAFTVRGTATGEKGTPKPLSAGCQKLRTG